MRYSLVVPVYNNLTTIEPTCEMIRSAFADSGQDYEILFVDDNSLDGSGEAINAISRNDSRVRYFRLDRNYGQFIALYAGLCLSSGEYSIVLSADLQEDAALLKGYIRESQALPGKDLFVGYRQQNSDYMLFRYLSAIFHAIIRMKIPNFPQGGFDTICIRSDLRTRFIERMRKNDFAQALLVQLSATPVLVPYHRKKSSTPRIYWKSVMEKAKYAINAFRYAYFFRFRPDAPVITYSIAGETA